MLVGLRINEGAGEDQDAGESEGDEDAELSEFDSDEPPVALRFFFRVYGKQDLEAVVDGHFIDAHSNLLHAFEH